jgi:hypothetical protein
VQRCVAPENNEQWNVDDGEEADFEVASMID